MVKVIFERLDNFVVIQKLIWGERDVAFYFPSDRIANFLLFNFGNLDHAKKTFLFGKRDRNKGRTKLFFLPRGPRREKLGEHALFFYFAFFNSPLGYFDFTKYIKREVAS